MIELNRIREDLREIRYYFSRKDLLDKAIQWSGKNELMDKIETYNKAMQSAPPRLLDVYYSLYVKNHTQESLSNELGFSTEYIYLLNRQLLKFLQKQLSK